MNSSAANAVSLLPHDRHWRLAISIGLTCGLAIWAIVFVVPLAALYLWPAPRAAASSAGISLDTLLHSIGLSAAIAAVAVVLGYCPSRLLAMADPARSSFRQGLMLLLLIAPLLLPSYVLYYAWSLLLSPTAWLGQYTSANSQLAQLAGRIASTGALMLWHWPLAAIILAQGWRNIDAEVMEAARMDGSPLQRAMKVTLPLLARPLLLAFAVCFSLSLSEFTTFHLAAVRTVGTDLAVVYELTASPAAVGRAAWPMLLPALAVALALWRSPLMSLSAAAPTGESRPYSPLSRSTRILDGWVMGALLTLSLAAPVALFIWGLRDLSALRQFGALHADELLWSGLIAAAAAGISLLAVSASLWLHRLAKDGAADPAGAGPRPLRILAAAMQVTILLAMFLPGSIVAAAILQLMAAMHLPSPLRQSWLVVSAGLVTRYAGLGLIVLRFARDSQNRHLDEMAAVDGATPLQGWLHVHWPRLWPLPVGAAMLMLMFGMTEIPATLILLPAGLPSFAQRLLNQMHYARDQQVIVSCLTLVGAYALLGGAVVAMIRLFSSRLWRDGRPATLAPIALGLCLLIAGCDKSASESPPQVIGAFGKTGTGEGEFIYPRAIDTAADGSLFVCDKTGRIQHFDGEGRFLNGFSLPAFQAGKPTGLSVGPDGNVWVADTHYNRVAIFTPAGRPVGEFGRFGREDGCFIFPTDVAFADDGRIFVSEYGGNDRISVYRQDKPGEFRFLRSFGACGSGEGQFSRPAAMAIDRRRQRMYVADACNHRIAIYDLSAGGEKLAGYFGAAGTGLGEFRYPYGLAILPDGRLAVCEYGNNRLQILSLEGQLRPLKTLGQAGRELGQLAYPWSLAVDGRQRAYVVDSGTNRIQIWQL